MIDNEQCPCGSGLNYRACCGPIHDKTIDATTAEQLMRSRYTAFVLENRDYLLYSWHPDTRPKTLDFDPNSKWLGLKVKTCLKGGASDSLGSVSFVARYKVGGKAERIVEDSEFVRIEGRWVYHSARR